MEIIDREREKKWVEQMDTILIFVCFACFRRPAELIGPPGRAICWLLKRFPYRAPQSP